jgi:hypothetical protein
MDRVDIEASPPFALINSMVRIPSLFSPLVPIPFPHHLPDFWFSLTEEGAFITDQRKKS